MLAAKAVHIAQPDLNHTGGLLEGKRIAAVADAEGSGVAPHNPNGPIAGAAALHFAVSTPNFVIQEEMSGAVTWYDDVVDVPMRRTGSHWAVPTAPGLGVEIDEREAAKHPYQPEVPHTAPPSSPTERWWTGEDSVYLRAPGRRLQRHPAAGRVRRPAAPPTCATRWSGSARSRALVVTTPGRAGLGDRVAAQHRRPVRGPAARGGHAGADRARPPGPGQGGERGADCLVARRRRRGHRALQGHRATSRRCRSSRCPTTYSGSEMTGFCGITIDGVKRMHESLAMLAVHRRLRRRALAGLPPAASAASAMNALAHCVDAIYLPTLQPAARAGGGRGRARSSTRCRACSPRPTTSTPATTCSTAPTSPAPR